MRELGYVERRDYVLEWRFAERDAARLPALAAELVVLKVFAFGCSMSPCCHAQRSDRWVARRKRKLIWLQGQ